MWKYLGSREYPVPVPNGEPVKVTASLGLAFYPSKDVTSPDLLLRFADEALYRAKGAGRNTICVYQAQGFGHEAER
jgi:diguanylate cyclase (GGDEF)-like protein